MNYRLQAVPLWIVEVARNSRARKNWSKLEKGKGGWGLGERREKGRFRLFLLAPVSLRSTDQKGTACSLIELTLTEVVYYSVTRYDPLLKNDSGMTTITVNNSN